MKENKRNLKSNKAITLIALVITIIVILILAGVTIATLTGDNGLLQKAQTAKKELSESEICEQLKLVYAEYKIGQYSTAVDVQKSIEDLFGKNNVSEVSINNGKFKATIYGDDYVYEEKTGVAKKYKDPFNYGTKEIESLEEGDTIALGTENFKVFAVTDNEIKAMPFYNLLLSSNPIKQGTYETRDTTGTSEFSSESYWNAEEDINMENSKNKIQTYINDYKTTLENMGAEDIKIRIPKTSDFSYKKGEEQIEVTASLKNPSGQGQQYWIGTCSSDKNRVRIVYPNGVGYSEAYNITTSTGVRPIIIIDK